MKNAKLYLITIVCLTLCWALIPINQATAGTITETMGASNNSPTLCSGECDSSTKSITMDGTEVMLVEYDSRGVLVAKYPTEDNLPSLIPYNEEKCSGELYRTDTSFGDWSLVDTYTIDTGKYKINANTHWLTTDQTYTGYKYYYFLVENFEYLATVTNFPTIPETYNFNKDDCTGKLVLRETSEGPETFQYEYNEFDNSGREVVVLVTSYDVTASYYGMVLKNKKEYQNNYREVYERSCPATYSGNIDCESCRNMQME